MAKITYENKQFLNQNSNIPDVNKCMDSDMNEIKQVVNSNDDEFTNLVTYSNDEINTNKIWIDGKPIYRKVYQKTVAANSTGTESLTNLNFDKIWVNGNSFNNYETTGVSSLNWYNGATDYGLAYINTSGVLNIKNASDRLRNYYIIIEYTKTTD